MYDQLELKRKKRAPIQGRTCFPEKTLLYSDWLWRNLNIY